MSSACVGGALGPRVMESVCSILIWYLPAFGWVVCWYFLVVVSSAASQMRRGTHDCLCQFTYSMSSTFAAIRFAYFFCSCLWREHGRVRFLRHIGLFPGSQSRGAPRCFSTQTLSYNTLSFPYILCPYSNFTSLSCRPPLGTVSSSTSCTHVPTHRRLSLLRTWCSSKSRPRLLWTARWTCGWTSCSARLLEQLPAKLLA